MRTGTSKMLDFLGLASQEAARKDLGSTGRGSLGTG